MKPEDGEIVVTGSAGGVGSVAVSLLASRGFTVVAATGHPEHADYLAELAATETIDRSELSEPGRPLGRERWAGATDSVGSHPCQRLRGNQVRGVVAACGLAQGFDLPATVMPFILRGVTLAGVDSVYCRRAQRVDAWTRLATDLDIAKLDLITTKIGLGDVIATATEQLAGGNCGRIVVDVNR